MYRSFLVLNQHAHHRMSSFKLMLCTFMLFICFSEALGFKLQITSLPNSSCLYNASINTSEGPLILPGDIYRSCDINITSTHTIKISILPISGNTAATGSEYIYLQRLGPLDACTNRYVEFTHPLQVCDLHIWYDAINLYFRSNINISIHAGETIEADDSLRCPEVINHKDNEVSIPGCEVKVYESIIQCTSQLEYDWDSEPTTICDLQCPHNCSCILSNREVMYNCSIKHDLHRNSSAFLLFPSTILRLDMSKNGLTALKSNSFRTIGNFIMYLTLSFNFLITLPAELFNQLYNLTDLWIDSNHLKSLPVELFNDLHSLVVLSLQNNYLVSLSEALFRSLQRLENLDLAGNILVSLPTGLFNGLYTLTVLWMDSNRLKSLPVELFSGLHRLKTLYLANNSLESLPVQSFSGLDSLMFPHSGNNPLMSLPTGLFSSLNQLNGIWLDNNYLVSLPAGLFPTFHNLQLLKCQNNRITHIAQDAFSNLTALIVLYLGNNRLTVLSLHVFDDLVNLHILALSDNRLTEIPQLRYMTKLSLIILTGNALTDITDESFDGVPETVTIAVDQAVICVCYMNESE